ncbi:MAG: purine-nucleoside phosphorylase [Sporolactobacillus sp.]
MKIKRLDSVLRVIGDLPGERPRIALILGSGLGDIADGVNVKRVIDYRDLPEFPVPTAEGHKGRFVIGELGNQPVIVMQGRYHYYEGYSLEQIVLPVQVMHALGANTLIVTNAAGAVNRSFAPGDFMLINDHINMLGRSPLIGPNDEAIGPRFPDMTAAYDRELIALARRVSTELGMRLREGVYLATPGPQYETPAEVRMIRTLGADAVGMSTVPEVIAARHAGMRVLGLSCLTNMGAGMVSTPLSHQEVIETGQRVQVQFAALIRRLVAEL